MEQVPVSICPESSRALPASSALGAATHALLYRVTPIPSGIAQGTATSATARAPAGGMIQDALVLLVRAHVPVREPLIIVKPALTLSALAGMQRVSAMPAATLRTPPAPIAAESASRATARAAA
jgi:hypothetical protein